MADKRIINLTEASDFANDDYFVIDNATLGTRKLSKDVIVNLVTFADADNDGNVVIA